MAKSALIISNFAVIWRIFSLARDPIKPCINFESGAAVPAATSPRLADHVRFIVWTIRRRHRRYKQTCYGSNQRGWGIPK
jgi:hypothetical protein